MSPRGTVQFPDRYEEERRAGIVDWHEWNQWVAPCIGVAARNGMVGAGVAIRGVWVESSAGGREYKWMRG